MRNSGRRAASGFDKGEGDGAPLPFKGSSDELIMLTASARAFFQLEIVSRCDTLSTTDYGLPLTEKLQ
jgi:hypothetical protein